MPVDIYENERERLTRRLIDTGYISSQPVIEAMRKVPRHLFVPERLKLYAYDDRPLPIGAGQTISAPHMVGMMTELLNLNPGMKVLEIGAGSGYHSAVIAEIIGEAGHVYTIDRIPELVENAKRNLALTGYGKLVTVIASDGSKGYQQKAPYDRILVTAGAPEIPKPLCEQLKIEGIIVIPVGGYTLQDLLVAIKKDQDKFDVKNRGPCAFVPLVGEYGWGE
ncbi:MAG: protein-L-isoaspartate O-methyltransferase [Euryarchaeota archaeon]|nr:protein-L-isoaspartate O-methyltransferase [Euryarchaeota archaeon]